MNILDGIRFAIRRQDNVAAANTLAALPVVQAATNILSIKGILEGKGTVEARRTTENIVKTVRESAWRARTTGQPAVAIDQVEKTFVQRIADLVKTGATEVVTRTVGAIASAMFKGIRYAFVPLARAVAGAAGIVFRLLMQPQVLIPLAAVAGGVYLYRKWAERKEAREKANAPKEPELAPVSKPSTVNAAALSKNEIKSVIRNNPGNIRFAGQPGATGTKGQFATFATQEEGIYNVGRQFQLYSKRGLNTLRQMISTYAPPNENNTKIYINAVAKRMGVDPDQTLDMDDPAVVESLIRNILIQESGWKLPYTKEQYQDAARRSVQFRKNGFKDYVVEPSSKTQPAAVEPSPTLTSSRLIVPTSGVMSSGFGPRKSPVKGASTNHQGVDIAAPVGTPVVAANDGVVDFAGIASGYGNLIVVRGAQFSTKYGHLSKFNVKQGDKVSQGQRIGEVGNTGVSSGPHLHFEVITANKPVDPADYVPGIPKAAKGQKVVTGLPPSVTPTPDYVNIDGKILRIEQ